MLWPYSRLRERRFDRRRLLVLRSVRLNWLNHGCKNFDDGHHELDGRQTEEHLWTLHGREQG